MKMVHLTPKERVLTCIRHEKTDRIPRGELLVEEAFLDRLYSERRDAPYMEKMRQLIEDAELDLVTVTIGEEDDARDLGKWVNETPCFVMGLVDGLFWSPKDPLSFEEFVMGIYRGESPVRELIKGKKERTIRLIKMCLDEGVHGMIIGDDLAFNGGPFVSPKDLSAWIIPGLQEIVEVIKTSNRVAFLHSCGNLTGILDLIISAGFHGLHGLAPSAGNEPLQIRRMTSKRLVLMGMVDVDGLKPLEIKNMRSEVLGHLAEGGGYILGSSGGLSMNTPLDSFRALYLCN
ncbi:MAG: uroporphyrinogen decarboxylase family protein [Pseudomonadota bacterium]